MKGSVSTCADRERQRRISDQEKRRKAKKLKELEIKDYKTFLKKTYEIRKNME